MINFAKTFFVLAVVVTTYAGPFSQSFAAIGQGIVNDGRLLPAIIKIDISKPVGVSDFFRFPDQLRHTQGSGFFAGALIRSIVILPNLSIEVTIRESVPGVDVSEVGNYRNVTVIFDSYSEFNQAIRYTWNMIGEKTLRYCLGFVREGEPLVTIPTGWGLVNFPLETRAINVSPLMSSSFSGVIEFTEGEITGGRVHTDHNFQLILTGHTQAQVDSLLAGATARYYHAVNELIMSGMRGARFSQPSASDTAPDPRLQQALEYLPKFRQAQACAGSVFAEPAQR